MTLKQFVLLLQDSVQVLEVLGSAGVFMSIYVCQLNKSSQSRDDFGFKYRGRTETQCLALTL